MNTINNPTHRSIQVNHLNIGDLLLSPNKQVQAKVMHIEDYKQLGITQVNAITDTDIPIDFEFPIGASVEIVERRESVLAYNAKHFPVSCPYSSNGAIEL